MADKAINPTLVDTEVATVGAMLPLSTEVVTEARLTPRQVDPTVGIMALMVAEAFSIVRYVESSSVETMLRFLSHWIGSHRRKMTKAKRSLERKASPLMLSTRMYTFGWDFLRFRWLSTSCYQEGTFPS